MDIVDRSTRSAMMARIGPRDTVPEMAVRRIAHRLGYRFRLHRRDLPGTPDLVFARHRVVVFVHGCFWHRHPDCKNCTTPKTRPEFWASKFSANVTRDARNLATIEALGWHPLVIWECEAEDMAIVERKLNHVLSGQGSTCKESAA